MNDNAFDADLYSIHKNHEGETLDRNITINQAINAYEQEKKEKEKD